MKSRSSNGTLLEDATTNRVRKGLKKLIGLASTHGRRILNGINGLKLGTPLSLEELAVSDSSAFEDAAERNHTRKNEFANHLHIDKYI